MRHFWKSPSKKPVWWETWLVGDQRYKSNSQRSAGPEEPNIGRAHSAGVWLRGGGGYIRRLRPYWMQGGGVGAGMGRTMLCSAFSAAQAQHCLGVWSECSGQECQWSAGCGRVVSSTSDYDNKSAPSRSQPWVYMVQVLRNSSNGYGPRRIHTGPAQASIHSVILSSSIHPMILQGLVRHSQNKGRATCIPGGINTGRVPCPAPSGEEGK